VKADELRNFLKQRDIGFEEDSIQNATRFRGPDGEVFCVYDTSKLVLQGNRESALATAVDEWAGKGGSVSARVAQSAVASSSGPPVFIVYGHDIAARDNLELLLRRMGLEPIILANLPASGDTIIEKLEHYLGEHGDVGYACVLLTPDDEGSQSWQRGREKISIKAKCGARTRHSARSTRPAEGRNSAQAVC
jgi:predicted nucleotide-binding protein